jgi:hypothetical protein
VPDGHFEVRIGALLTPSRERNMDLPRRDLTKTAVLGPITAGTGALPPVGNFFEPLAGLTAAAKPVLILTQQLTPTAHDPSARRSRTAGTSFAARQILICHT